MSSDLDFDALKAKAIADEQQQARENAEAQVKAAQARIERRMKDDREAQLFADRLRPYLEGKQLRDGRIMKVTFTGADESNYPHVDVIVPDGTLYSIDYKNGLYSPIEGMGHTDADQMIKAIVQTLATIDEAGIRHVMGLCRKYKR